MQSGLIVVGPLKSKGESDRREGFATDGGLVWGVEIQVGVGEQDQMPVANDGSLGADLVVVEVEEVFEFAKEFLDLPAEGEAVEDFMGREGEAIGDEDMNVSLISAIPGADGDDDLFFASKPLDLGEEGVGEKDSRFSRGVGNRYRATEFVARDDFVEVICVNPSASEADESICFGLRNPGQILGGAFEERDKIFGEIPGVEDHVGEGDFGGYGLFYGGFGQFDLGFELGVGRAEGEGFGG